MTITTQPVRNSYVSGAGQTIFNYTFKIFLSSDLDVTVNDVLTTSYVVDPNTIGDPSGGFITFNSPLSSGDEVVIVSDIPFNRTTDYQNNGDFRPDVVNADFDRVVSLVKQVEDDVSENTELINELDANNLKISDGQNTMAQPIIMGGQRIHSVGAPVAPDDAVNDQTAKEYDAVVEAHVAEVEDNSLQRKGGQNAMLQELSMSSNRITDLGAPTGPDDAVRLQDVPTLNGDSIVVSTKEEEQVVVDGQTTITFSELTTAGGAIYVAGDNVDRGRLDNPVDFSIVNATTIELTESFPAGSIIRLVQNEGAAETGNNRRVRDFSTLADAIANVGLQGGDSCNLKERISGDGGGAMWDVVLASSVTPNTYGVVACTGVPTLALVLREAEILYASHYGVVPTATEVDQTAGVEFLIQRSNDTGKKVIFTVLPTTAYYVTEIYIAGRRIQFEGSTGRQEYGKAEFKSIAGTLQNPVDAFVYFGNSVDQGGSTTRNCTFKNIMFVEGGQVRTFGMWGYGQTFCKWENVLTQGFDTAWYIDYTWNCSAQDIDLYHFRDKGFQTGPTVINTMPMINLHCSSNVVGSNYDLYLQSCNSLVFSALTTEGQASTHVYFGNGARNFNVDGWHLEGGDSIIEVDRGALSSPAGSINIKGAAFFCGSSVAGDKLLKFTNSTSAGGLMNFNISGNISLDTPNCDKSFLSLTHALRSNLDATIQFNPTHTENNDILWSEIGTSLGPTYLTGIQGHSGRYDTRSNQLFNGARRQWSGQFNTVSAASLDNPYKIMKVPVEHIGKDLFIDMLVTVDYASGIWSGIIPYAKFTVLVAGNGTITSILGDNLDQWAKDTLFTWDNVNGELFAQNIGLVGSAKFSYDVKRIDA